jgi:hypothetical protein
MQLIAILTVGLGAVINGIGAAMDGEDVVRASLLGVVGGALAAGVLFAVALLADSLGIMPFSLYF